MEGLDDRMHSDGLMLCDTQRPRGESVVQSKRGRESAIMHAG